MKGKPGTCLTAPAPLENDEGEVDGGGDMNAAGSGAFRERALGGSEGTSAATDPAAHAGHRIQVGLLLSSTTPPVRV